jgi:hypothetical protein
MPAARPWIFAGVLWLIVVGTGFGILLRYSSTRGDETRTLAVWPSSSRLSRASDRWTLLMFLHPNCPCSRASVAELGRLMSRVRGRVATKVVFVRPEGVSPELVEDGLRVQASGLPDTVVLDDTNGEMERFGAETSGAVLLYDPSGTLMFSGGLTAVRGHEGNSFGQERIVALVTTGAADRADSPVFGCSLAEKKEEQ